VRSFFVASIGLVLLPACGQPAQEKQPACPSGICGTATTGSGGSSNNGPTGSGTGSGSGTGGATSGSSSSGVVCTEAWSCTPWLQGSDGMYTRTCTDANGCNTTLSKPPEGPVALPELDFDYYKCKVEPILDRGCAFMGCHGTETGRAFKIYARGRLRHKEMVNAVCPGGPQMLDLQANGSGTIMCLGWTVHTSTEWQSNYDIARSFMLGVVNPDDSDLLAEPVIGGKQHAGVHLFAKNDPDYTTIKSWLGGAKLGSTCNPAPN
jgi:hypothetical protein